MKRIAIIVLTAAIAASSLSAQGMGRGNAAPVLGTTATTAETVTVDGKLALINGMIGVKSGDKTYYTGGLQRLIGFIDGLKEGAAVKLEGYAQTLPVAPEYIHLRVTKLTLNGKDYDLSETGGRMGGMMDGAMDGRMGGGQGRMDDDRSGRAMGGRGRR